MDGRHPSAEVEERARQSAGGSNAAIYDMVREALEVCGARGRRVVDVGCGTGRLSAYVKGRFDTYVGVDAVRYDGFPEDAAFHQCDLDGGRIPLEDAAADVVAAVEVIEHLENPRALVRELARVAAPGGWVVVTTPNQLSGLSLLTLLVKHRFSAFQDVHYPRHLTALLEVDLLRIARENGLTDVTCRYSLDGRIPLTAAHWPRTVSRCFPRTLSDNILMMGRKPAA
ncbi:MAG: class I SAM-dependent methyltransferase [Candidatus Binatia bacterium]